MALVGQQCVVVVFSYQTPHYLIVSYIEAQTLMNKMKKKKQWLLDTTAQEGSGKCVNNEKAGYLFVPTP